MRHFNYACLTLLPLLIIQLIVGCSGANENSESVPKDDLKKEVGWDTTANGLIFTVVHRGTGPEAKSGDKALIHETTKLKDGTVITDTWEMNFPIPFIVDGNQVIDGLNQAVKGMKVGERKKLIVPPSLSRRSSYPENGSYKPEDTLYYNVILLKVEQQKNDELF